MKLTFRFHDSQVIFLSVSRSFNIQTLILLYASYIYLLVVHFTQYAHRKCVQHWCNEKGDITCEICHQVCSWVSVFIVPTLYPIFLCLICTFDVVLYYFDYGNIYHLLLIFFLIYIALAAKYHLNTWFDTCHNIRMRCNAALS